MMTIISWDTLLIATVPSLITYIVTNLLTRREYKAKIDSILTDNKTKETDNLSTILESYNLVLAQHKLEIEDANKRLSEYMREANLREDRMKLKLEKAVKEVVQLKKDNAILKEKVRVLSDDICEVKGITKEELFKDIDNSILSEFTNENN